MSRTPAPRTGRGPPRDAAARVRAQLIADLHAHLRRQGWDAAVAAQQCGLTPARFEELVAADVGRFDLEALLAVATHLGFRAEITFWDEPGAALR